MDNQPKKNEVVKKANDNDPIVIAIIHALNIGESPTFKDIAVAVANERRKPKDDPNLWQRYLKAVKQQAIHLAKSERIVITRKGKPVDPKKIKGIVKMRLPPG